ncbi:unnamed protein product [Discosporangium mesarthrocarpum]
MELWLVRHGERIDEVSGKEGDKWRRSSIARKRWFDPPLTFAGHQQATQAGLYLAAMSFNQSEERERSGFTRVYTSPLLRAVQTAVRVSESLGGLPIQVVTGLCECAASVRVKGLHRLKVMSDQDIVNHFPRANLIPRNPHGPRTFGEACQWLAQRPARRVSQPLASVLAVSHREGTRNLAGRFKVPTPYCCIGLFTASDRGTNDNNSATPRMSPAASVAHPYRIVEIISYKGKSLWVPPVSESVIEVSEALDSLAVSPPLPLREGKDETNGREGDPVTSMAVAQPEEPTGKTLKGRGTGRKPVVAAPMAAKPTPSRRLPGETPSLSSGLRLNLSRPQGRDVRRLVNRGSRGQGGGPGIYALPHDTFCESRNGMLAYLQAGDLVQVGKVCPALLHVFISFADDLVSFMCSFTRISCASTRARKQGPWRECIKVYSALPCSAGHNPTHSPPSLALVSYVCKNLRKVATKDHLWHSLYLKLPSSLQRRSEVMLSSPSSMVMPGRPFSPGHYRELFFLARHIMGVDARIEAAKAIAATMRDRGLVHGLRDAVARLTCDRRLYVEVNGMEVASMDNLGRGSGRAGQRGSRWSRPKPSWAATDNTLSSPIANAGGVRTFALSSSLKVDPLGGGRGTPLLQVELGSPMLESGKGRGTGGDCRRLLADARLVGKTADGALMVYDMVPLLHCDRGEGHDRSTDNGTSSSTSSRTRACVLLGLLGDSNQGPTDTAMSVGFLTVHVPHQMVLDRATRCGLGGGNPRLSNRVCDGVERSSCMEAGGTGSRTGGGSGRAGAEAGGKSGLTGLSVALSLRTAGVTSWEASVLDIDAKLVPPLDPWDSTPSSMCPRSPGPDSGHPEPPTVAQLAVVMPSVGGAMGRPFTIPQRSLAVRPGLPFSTAAGLQGCVEGLLLADLALWAAGGAEGSSLWAFSSPIAFSPAPNPGSGNTGRHGPYPGEEEEWVDFGLGVERRECRLRGSVEESGVGTLKVELALLEGEGDGEESVPGGAGGRGKGADSGCRWVVRRAVVELEPDFLDRCGRA